MAQERGGREDGGHRALRLPAGPAALAAVTHGTEIMTAVRPTFHLPSLLAKQAANIDRIGNTKLERRVSIEDYTVSNRGLRAGLVGAPEQVAQRILAFEAVGLDLLLRRMFLGRLMVKWG